jgi:hypothetical protein
MSTPAFQLDPSLAGLSPALLRKRYDQLTPEQRRALGFVRLASEEEAARALQSEPGAPVDFAGRVFPNSNQVRVSADTESGIEPTQLPAGVSFQRGNFTGAMPTDFSNPPRTEMAAPAMQTIAAKSNPPTDGSAWKPVEETSSAWKPVEETKPPEDYLTRTEDMIDESAQTLAREVGAAGSTIAGIPGAIWHAFRDPETDEERAQREKIESAGGNVPNDAISRAIFRLSGAGQTERAIKFYAQYAKASPEEKNRMESEMLSVAPEAIGAGAGAVLTPKLIESTVRGAPSLPSTTKLTAPVRAVAKATNKVLAKAPATVGGTVGAAAGGYFGGHVGAEIGGAAGALAGKELLPTLRVPLENVGLPSRVTGGPAEAPIYESPAVSEPAPAASAPPATPAEILNKPGTPLELQKLLDEALGGRPLQRGVPLRNQGQAPAPAPKLPEGFTPVESTALRGYKYDPATREFESVTTGGQHYIHGDVSPEEAQAFAEAESKGRAWQKIRENPLVAKVVAGERVSVKPGSMQSAATGEIIPKSEAGMGDLTNILQQSLDQAQTGKGGVITSASPKALMDRWGVDPESLAAGREQTRGMSAEETEASIQKLAAAYKKGQAVEPVMETRDAQNNLIDVDGRGRAIAAHRAGIKRIPVIVRRMQ